MLEYFPRLFVAGADELSFFYFLLERRKKPLAPTCRMCLIRDDLSTLWCEVTSSIRTRSPDEDQSDTPSLSSSTAPATKLGLMESHDGSAPPAEDFKEILLCLRPIRDGEKKVDEAFRFVSSASKLSGDADSIDLSPCAAAEAMVSASSAGLKDDTDNFLDTMNERPEKRLKQSPSRDVSKRPPKKRPPPSRDDSGNSFDDEEVAVSRRRRTEKADIDAEKSVVESLMLMNKSQ